MMRPVRIVALLAGAVALGALAGPALAPTEETTRTVRVGGVSLDVPRAWSVTRARALVLVRDEARVVAAFGEPADASLVPAGLPRARGGEPAEVRLGGYRAWSYPGVTVLPTARGVLACSSRCADVARSLRGAPVLYPESDLALRLHAPAVLGELDALRVRVRRELRRSGGEAGPARELAEAHRHALASLRPFVSPQAALPRALAEGARAYDAMAQARRSRSRRAEVRAADARLETAVARLAEAGAPAVQQPAEAATLRFPVWPVALLVVALLLALVPRRRPTRVAAPPPRTVTLDAPVRAQPQAGRWDEVPHQLSGRPSP